jgi:septal ring factor EnvC (AmiA/AmiB activator)
VDAIQARIDELSARKQELEQQAQMLEAERDELDPYLDTQRDRYYFLDAESRVLREQALQLRNEAADLIGQEDRLLEPDSPGEDLPP